MAYSPWKLIKLRTLSFHETTKHESLNNIKLEFLEQNLTNT